MANRQEFRQRAAHFQPGSTISLSLEVDIVPGNSLWKLQDR